MSHATKRCRCLSTQAGAFSTRVRNHPPTMPHALSLAAGASALLLLLCAWCAMPRAVWASDKQQTVLWVDSYHEGYAWSDGIGQGIRNALAGSGVRLEVLHMDTKRRHDIPSLERAGRDAMALIETLRPDVVIASDDNAQHYLVVPFLLRTDVPVVFCGVNAKPEDYGYPAANVTGMLEVEPLDTLFWQLGRLADGKRVAYISGDVATDHKVIEKYNQEYFQGAMLSYLARDFEEFKDLYARAQEEADMLMFMNNGGIEGWDDAQAREFILRHTVIPSGSVADYLKRFTIITLGKDPLEQGEFAGQTALRILSGTPAADIPITRNERVHMTINLELADAAGIMIPLSALKAAAEVLKRDGR